MTHYVYAGVPQWSSTEDSEPLGGLFRQEMGESKWHHLGKGLPDKAEVRAITIHPNDPQIVYVGTQHGPYCSTDSGEHWQPLAKMVPVTLAQTSQTRP